MGAVVGSMLPVSSAPVSSSRSLAATATSSGELVAETELCEAPDVHLLAHLRAHLTDQLLNGFFVVSDPWLPQQTVAPVEGLEFPLNDLRDDVVGLPLLASDLLVDLSFPFDLIVGNVLGRDPPSLGGGHLHGQLPRKLLELLGVRHEVCLAIDLDEDTQSPQVDIGLDPPLVGRSGSAPLQVRLPLLAEHVDGLIDIATRLLQGPLAIHHSGSGDVPKPLHQLWCDCHGHSRPRFSHTGLCHLPASTSVAAALVACSGETSAPASGVRCSASISCSVPGCGDSGSASISAAGGLAAGASSFSSESPYARF